jgi:putative inorganic carbon (hco3(-)) transporter
MSAHAATLSHMRIFLTCAAAGFMILFLVQQNILLGLGALVILGSLAAVLRWPEVGILVFLFSVYSNLAVLAMRSQRDIQAAAGPATENPRVAVVLAGLSLLLCVPLVHQLFIRKERLIFDRGFALMVGFLLVLLASAFFARDNELSESQITDYLLEGLALYFVVTNVIRNFSTLRRATWALLLAGSLMAGISLFQKITHTQKNIYGGMAQVLADFHPGRSRGKLEDVLRSRTLDRGSANEGGEVVGQLRAAGPVGEPNRYAQILVVLLPLVGLFIRTERSRALRAFVLVTGGLILGALFLTMSRGALLTALILFAMMAYTRLLKPRHVLISLLGASLLIGTVGRGVVARVASVERVSALFSRTYSSYSKPDSSVLLRYVEGAAAWHVFLDHPILGVGPGHFAQFYSMPYGNRIGLVQVTQGYRGHDLYLETLAETGVIGLACLLAIIFVITHKLWRERRRFTQSRPELAHTATAFFLCLVAYAISALFAHLSYQRYFWLLVGLSSAALRIVHSHCAEQTSEYHSFAF